MKKVLFFAIVIVFFSSCNVYKHTSRSTSIANNELITNNIVVDVKVEPSKIVTATSGVRESIELAKNEAYYKAITEKNIDIVVDPIFEISTIGTKYTAKVTGYAGYYTNPRSKIEAVKELKEVKSVDITSFDKLYNFEPTTQTVVAKNSTTQSDSKSKVVLPFGLQSYIPVRQTAPHGKSFEVSIYSSQNQLSLGSEFLPSEIDNNGNTLSLAYDFNPNKKIGVKSELMFGLNKEYNQLSKNIYLRFSLLKKFNLVAGPSVLYFLNNDAFKKYNFGYTAGASYTFGNRVSVIVRTQQYSNISNEFTASYATLNFGIGYKF
jgi:hypothetical protein